MTRFVTDEGRRLSERLIERRRRDRRRHERATSLVEFVFIMIPLFLLLFGIIGFAVLLSFKQTMTQSANEGARAAAVTDDDLTTTGTDERVVAGRASVAQFEGWGRRCGTGAGNVDCSDVTVHDCDDPPGTTNDPAVFPDCVTVHLSYDYDRAPILPNLPFVGALMPDTVETTATAQLTYYPAVP